jgi:putative FmdB family regulatory protein
LATYEYACRGCGTHFEVVQRMTAKPLKICDSCGGELRRVLFAPSVIYKGSGFYTTDYARKNGSGESKADGDRSEKKSEDGKSDDRKSDDRKSDDRKSDDRKSDDRKSDDNKRDDRKSDDKKETPASKGSESSSSEKA